MIVSSNFKVKNGWITDTYGTKFHYKNNVLHRDDGPSIIVNNGHKAWYINGKKHREDGPAVIVIDGYKAWYINGKRHRTDGPAVIYKSGFKTWWLNGKEYSFREYCKKLNLSNEQILKLALKYNL